MLQILYRSQSRITRSIRSILGSADFSVFVYHIRNDLNSAIAIHSGADESNLRRGGDIGDPGISADVSPAKSAGTS
jgi:hypothetical protein